MPEGLGGALDRFAHFFISPRFDPDVVEREVKAVDSEFLVHLQSDAYRLNAILAETSRAGHPARKFSIGNLKSLKQEGVDLRAAVADFHASHYSANLMRLCVLGPRVSSITVLVVRVLIVSSEDLHTLIEMAAGLFSDVPTANRRPSIWPGNPIGPEQLNVSP